MKRVLACFLLVSLLLMAGCSFNINGVVEPLTEPSGTNGTQPTGESTAAPTQQVTEPVVEHPENVTVYLVDQQVMVDNGYMDYIYATDGTLEKVVHWGIENDLMSTTYYEDVDANGMPGKVRTVWPDGEETYYTITYFQDGKLDSVQYSGAQYTGNQYGYDAAGNMTERRSYYDGILDSTVIYEYDGQTLVKVYCENVEGQLQFDTKVENGRIMEVESHLEAYGYRFAYDENGNLTSSTFLFEGEEMPSSTYTYKAIEVDQQRAQYIMELQKYLLSVV